VQLTKEVVEKHKNTSHFWFAKVAVSGTELQTGLILKPEPGPRQTIIKEARFTPESQIYRLSQNMRNCGVSKNVV